MIYLLHHYKMNNPEYKIGHPIQNALTNDNIIRLESPILGGSKEEKYLFRVMNGGNKLFFSNPDEYELWQQDLVEKRIRTEVIPVSNQIRDLWHKNIGIK